MWPRVKKFFKYVWEADTITAYSLNILFAFLIIKFLVYPGLGLIFGTSFPVVAVVSSSMEHDGSFQNWFESPAVCGSQPCTQQQWYTYVGVTKNSFENFFFRNGFNKGDVMVLFGTKPKRLEVGDVIVFRAQQAEPIIHRIVAKQERDGRLIFSTKGDHNPAQLPVETYISEEQILGRAVFRIPFFGYIKIWFVQLLNLIRF